ncbi:MAG TPA: Nudix family hydrolase [Burkholderiales bacterium]|nr:Nudix family hydrolase [Burkholderiales bacterium]
MTEVVNVAAAVLIQPDGSFLLAQRPARTVYAGYWEFPGGKVESGETPLEALAREVEEEIGIRIAHADPWITQTFVYPHATVRLHFFRVRDWVGVMHGREGQALAWQRPGKIEVGPLLPANAPVLRALSLPTEYAVSNATEIGERAFLSSLQKRLSEGLKLLQLREKAMSSEQFSHFARSAITLAQSAGAQVLVNASINTARLLEADGVQLSAKELMKLENRPDLKLVGASIHNLEELRRAEALGVDFAVLGAVRATPTHPNGTVLGWNGFGAIVEDAAIPVYAIGGLRPADMHEAWRHSAHGLAMIRGSWGV